MAATVELYLSNPADRMLEDDEISLPEEYDTFCVIRAMGWDWWTYHNQPDFFIKQIRAFLGAEIRAKENRSSNNTNGQ